MSDRHPIAPEHAPPLPPPRPGEGAAPAGTPDGPGSGGSGPGDAGPGGAGSDGSVRRAEPNPTSQWVRLGLLVLALIILTRLTGWWGLGVVGGLVAMIFLHELGHFLMAKRAGMKVTEFFLGFGPKIWSFRRGETEYGIKVIPAGAYVKIIGMHNLDEVAPEDEGRTYRQKPFRDRLGVAVAGSAMHFIQALVLIFVMLVFVGAQGGALFTKASGPLNGRVEDVLKGSPAARAGLHEGDVITKLDGHRITSEGDFTRYVGHRPGQRVTVTFERHGQSRTIDAKIGRDPDHHSVGRLGIRYAPTHPVQKVGALEAVPRTFHEFGAVAVGSVEGLAKAFSPSALSNFGHQLTSGEQSDKGVQVTNPKGSHSSQSSQHAKGSSSGNDNSNRLLSIYGVFKITTSAAHSNGISAVLGLFILINVFIGLFNLLPLLPFDGGHVVIACYEKVQEWRLHRRRYFADVVRLLPLTYVVVVLLAGLFVTTLYLDIAKPVTLN